MKIDQNRKFPFFLIIYIFHNTNATLHFSLAGAINSYTSDLDDQLISFSSYYFTLYQPYSAYLIITGIFMLLNWLLGLVYYCLVKKGQAPNLSVQYILMTMNWYVAALNFANAIFLAITSSTLSMTLSDSDLSLSDTTDQYQNMYNLFIADTVITFLFGFPAQVLMSLYRINQFSEFKVKISEAMPAYPQNNMENQVTISQQPQPQPYMMQQRNSIKEIPPQKEFRNSMENKQGQGQGQTKTNQVQAQDKNEQVQVRQRDSIQRRSVQTRQVQLQQGTKNEDL